MVKGYDPTASDPSKIVLQYLLRWSSKPNPISLEQAQKYTKYWLKNSTTTTQIYNNFSKLDKNRPQIILKKKCSQLMGWSYWKLLLQQQNYTDQNYPAFNEDNKIVVCLNMISNKTQLKQNIDRQLTILWKNTQKQNKQKAQTLNNKFRGEQQQNKVEQRDKQYMQFLYEGCKQGYKNYMLQKDVQDRVSKKCAKYLFFRRCQRQLPWDAKFRYASKIVQQVI